MLARRALPLLSLAGQVPGRTSAAMGAALATRAYLRPATCRGPRSLPWVWPADQDTIPAIKPSSSSGPLMLRIGNFVTSKSIRLLVLGGMLNNDYMDAIQQAMVPAVLQKVIQAVNEMDPDACEQIMLPGLARQFGLGMDELRNDDSALHIEARNVRDVALEGLTLHVGPPAAFDTRVARTTRQSEYFYWSTGSSIHALDIGALRKGARKPKKTMAESLADPVSLHLNFCMTADIEMSRTKLGEVVDSDKGTMAVPLSLSTPTYPWLGSLPIVASGNKIIYSSDDLPPLEWRVSDVFRLVADKEFG